MEVKFHYRQKKSFLGHTVTMIIIIIEFKKPYFEFCENI